MESVQLTYSIHEFVGEGAWGGGRISGCFSNRRPNLDVALLKFLEKSFYKLSIRILPMSLPGKVAASEELC